MDTRQLSEDLRKDKDGFKELLTELPKSTAPRIEGWSDELLLNLREQYRFSPDAINRASRKRVYIRFYDFYFHGLVDDKDNSVAIVADAVAMSETLKGPIWFRAPTTGEFFHELNTSDRKGLSIQEVSPVPQVVFLSPTITSAQRQAYQALLVPYEDRNAKEFKAIVTKILQDYESEKAASRMEKRLQRLTGFLALTLWRAAIKNKDQLGNAFLKNQYRINLSTLADWPNELAFSPPCEECISTCTGSLIKGTVGASAMFTILASEYVNSRKPEYPDQYVAGYLSASVLTHTARNGLGILQMMEQACLITRKKWTELYELSYLNLTATSWKTIKLFFDTYLRKDKIQFGFNWARIINDGYLRDYSPKEMLFLAGIFAGIIEQSQGPGIWEAEWAKLHVDYLKGMREYGITLYRMAGPDIDKAIAATESLVPLALTKERLAKEAEGNGTREELERMIL